MCDCLTGDVMLLSETPYVFERHVNDDFVKHSPPPPPPSPTTPPFPSFLSSIHSFIHSLALPHFMVSSTLSHHHIRTGSFFVWKGVSSSELLENWDDVCGCGRTNAFTVECHSHVSYLPLRNLLLVFDLFCPLSSSSSSSRFLLILSSYSVVSLEGKVRMSKIVLDKELFCGFYFDEAVHNWN